MLLDIFVVTNTLLSAI